LFEPFLAIAIFQVLITVPSGEVTVNVALVIEPTAPRAIAGRVAGEE